MTLKTTRFYPDAYLDGPEAYAAFLEDAFESGDAGVIADALGVIGRAKGMTQLAEETGLSRATLYKAFSDDGNPSLSTLLKVASALGLGLGMKVREHA